MASRAAIVAAFAYFDGAGLPAPRTHVEQDGREAAVAVWAEQLRHISDRALGEAVRQVTPRTRFWPSVGQILAACPPPPPLPPLEDHAERHAYTDALPEVRAEVLRRWDPDLQGSDDAIWAGLDALTEQVIAERRVEVA